MNGRCFLLKALILCILTTLIFRPALYGQNQILRWSTFLGGAGVDEGKGVAIDAVGNVYIIGTSDASWGSPIRPYGGGGDVFVAKVDLNGILQWNTFLGASGRTDYCYGITTDSNENVYVTGWSIATWGSPVRPFSGHDRYEAFIAKLDSTGTLLWNTFLGAPDYSDYAHGIAVDSSGNIYLTGYSYDTWGAPIRPFQANFYEGWAAKLDGNGVLQWNTFLGGNIESYCLGIALDLSGSIYVCGASTSSWGNPIKPYDGVNWDGFVVKLSSSGILVWNTFLGREGSSGIKIDSGGDVFVGGGNDDIWVAKLSSSGLEQWSTSLGPSSVDECRGISLNSAGHIFITGYSQATWGVPDRAYSEGHDAFVAELDGNGILQWNTFLGGAVDDEGNGIAIEVNNKVYVIGASSATWGSPLMPFIGNGDAFLAKFKNTPGPSLSSLSPVSVMVGDSSFTLHVNGAEFVDGAIVRWDGADRQTLFIDSSELRATIEADDLAVAKVIQITVRNPDGEITDALEFTVRNYIPALSALTPSSARAGSPGFTLVLSGTNFVEGAIASWDGADCPTTYISSTEVRAEIGAGDIGVPKTVQVCVHNPGTEASTALEFIIEDPLPSLTSLVPSSAHTGDPGFTLSVIGIRFISGAVVVWEGSDRATSFVNNNEITTSISTADLSTPKTVQISVRNPDGGISNSLEFVISNPPTPTLISLSPIKITGGGASFSLTLIGTNFVANSVVKWDAVDKTTIFVSSTQLQAEITAWDISVGKEVQVTVVNPIPAGSASNALIFPVSSFTMTSSPASATVSAGQSAAFAIQITPQFGSFDSPISFTSTGLPRGCVGSISPPSVTPGYNVMSVALSLSTTANSSAASVARLGSGGGIPRALGFFVALIMLVGTVSIRKLYSEKLSFRWLSAVALICAIGISASCGAGGDNNPPPNTGTPPGTYQISVQGQSGSMTASTIVTLVVR
jgi:hypothetical protein